MFNYAACRVNGGGCEMMGTCMGLSQLGSDVNANRSLQGRVTMDINNAERFAQKCAEMGCVCAIALLAKARSEFPPRTV